MKRKKVENAIIKWISGMVLQYLTLQSAKFKSLNRNLTPLFKLTEIINISLTSFFRFVLKVTEPCFFPLEFIARVLRLGHRAGKPWSVTYSADLKRDLSFIVRLIRLRKIPKIETSSLYHCTDDPKRDRKNMKKSCKN